MILNSIPQRLPRLQRLQRVLNPFLRLAFAAKGLERLALEIQNILLADRSARGHVAPQRTSATSVPSFTSYSVMYSPGRMRRTHEAHAQLEGGLPTNPQLQQHCTLNGSDIGAR